MSRIGIVGGGFGGLASAVRLAKLGHAVTLYEASDSLGGGLSWIEQDGYRWDAGAAHTLLPAVVRDLFRKSGRPLDKELELVPVEPAQQHRWRDDDDASSGWTVLDLPGGSRGAQQHALDEALGAGTGAAWTAYTGEFADAWAALRTDWLETPYDPATASARTKRMLGMRYTLHKLVDKTLKDDRLRDLALTWARLEGHDPRNVPAWAGMTSYVEQNFGTWTVAGGMAAVTDALVSRLATRGVTVHTGVEVTDLGPGPSVRTQVGEDSYDHVVVAIDPRRLPVLARRVERTMPAIPPVVAHLGLVGDVPDLPHEVVLHDDLMLWVRTGGTAPPGKHAWTILGRGRLAEDIVTALARFKIDVREQVEVRVDRSPKDQVVAWRGSPYGVLWQGRRTLDHRLGTTTPLPGVLCAGAHTTPGAGLHYVGLSAALVAQVVGPA